MARLGEFIKERRLAKNLSVRALSLKSDISHTEIIRIERGQRKNPSIRLLNALAEVLDVPKNKMLREAGYQDSVGESIFDKIYYSLKTEKEREFIEKVVDLLIKNPNLNKKDYKLIEFQVEILLNYISDERKKTN